MVLRHGGIRFTFTAASAANVKRVLEPARSASCCRVGRPMLGKLFAISGLFADDELNPTPESVRPPADPT